MVVKCDWMRPKERIKKEKKEKRGREGESEQRAICCCFLNPSIRLFYWRTLWFGGPVSKVSRLCFWAVSNDSCVQAGPSTAPTVRTQSPENQGPTAKPGQQHYIQLHAGGFSLAGYQLYCTEDRSFSCCTRIQWASPRTQDMAIEIQVKLVTHPSLA